MSFPLQIIQSSELDVPDPALLNTEYDHQTLDACLMKGFKYIDANRIQEDMVRLVNEILYIYYMGCGPRDTNMYKSNSAARNLGMDTKRPRYATKRGELMYHNTSMLSVGEVPVIRPVDLLMAHPGYHTVVESKMRSIASGMLYYFEKALCFGIDNINYLYYYHPGYTLSRSKFYQTYHARTKLLFSDKESIGSMFLTNFDKNILTRIREACSVVKDPEIIAGEALRRMSMRKLPVLEARPTFVPFETKDLDDNIAIVTETGIPEYIYNNMIATLESLAYKASIHLTIHTKNSETVPVTNMNRPCIFNIDNKDYQNINVIYNPALVPTIAFIPMINIANVHRRVSNIYNGVINNVVTSKEREAIISTGWSTLGNQLGNTNSINGFDKDSPSFILHPYPVASSIHLRKIYRDCNQLSLDSDDRETSIINLMQPGKWTYTPLFETNEISLAFDKAVRDMETIYMNTELTADIYVPSQDAVHSITPFYAAALCIKDKVLNAATLTKIAKKHGLSTGSDIFKLMMSTKATWYSMTITEIYSLIHIYNVVCAVDNEINNTKDFYTPKSDIGKEIYTIIIDKMKEHNIMVAIVEDLCERMGIIQYITPNNRNLSIPVCDQIIALAGTSRYKKLNITTITSILANKKVLDITKDSLDNWARGKFKDPDQIVIREDRSNNSNIIDTMLHLINEHADVA